MLGLALASSDELLVLLLVAVPVLLLMPTIIAHDRELARRYERALWDRVMEVCLPLQLPAAGAGEHPYRLPEAAATVDSSRRSQS